MMKDDVEQLQQVPPQEFPPISKGQLRKYASWFKTRVQRALKLMGKRSTETVDLVANGEVIGRITLTRLRDQELLVEASLNGGTKLQVLGALKNHNFKEVIRTGFTSLDLQLLRSPHVVQRWLEIERYADGLN